MSIDQFFKFLFKNKNFFIFHYQTNTGIAFSLFQGYNLLFLMISLFALGFCAYYLFHYHHKKLIGYGLSFLIGGITSNSLDRIIHGFVVDYIDFKIWPVFNVADLFNILGVTLLIVYSYKTEKK